MKYTLVSVVTFVTMVLAGCQLSEKKNQENLIADAKIDTSVVAILPFDSSTVWLEENGKPAELSDKEYSEVETILNNCIKTYNIEQEKEMKRIKENYSNAEVNRENFVIELKNYKRQYIVFTSSKQEKIVWINCLCDASGNYWKKELQLVDDGGNCYFNIRINLNTKQGYDLMVNGVA